MHNYSLGAVNQHIKKKLLPSHSLLLDKEFLQRLSERIDAILHIQKGWLTVGLINDYHFNQQQKLPSAELDQNMILKEAKLAHCKMLGFVYHETNQLIHDINAERTSHGITTDYYEVLTELLTYCVGVHTVVADHITPRKSFMDPKHLQINLSQEENEFFSAENEDVKLIALLGGTYFPFSQRFDPLRGMLDNVGILEDQEGHCVGYAEQWKRAIKQGNRLTMPVLDDEVHYYQQMNSFCQHFKFFSFPKKSIYLYTDEEFMHNPALLSQKMLDKNIYFLKLRYREPVAHVMGIRKIPSSQVIELFDPEFGLVVFNNLPKFNEWFSHYLEKNYRTCKTISLHPVAKQPSDAKPFLPCLNEPIVHPKIFRYNNGQF